MKFARHLPAAEDAERAYDAAAEFVESTAEKPEVSACSCMIRGCWLLLLLLPLLVRLAAAGAARATLRFPLLGAVRAVGRRRRAHWRWVLAARRAPSPWCCWSPRWRGRSSARRRRKVYSEGIDIMLAVDVSGSMLAEDFTVDGQRANRLDAVKSVVRDFLPHRAGDRVGLVLFAARPYTQCAADPRPRLAAGEPRSRPGRHDRGRHGRRLGAGDRRQSARGSDRKSKIVILLTDGQNNAGKVPPLTAAEAAKTLGYRVYTIGAGTRGAGAVSPDGHVRPPGLRQPCRWTSTRRPCEAHRRR